MYQQEPLLFGGTLDMCYSYRSYSTFVLLELSVMLFNVVCLFVEPVSPEI